MSAEKLADASWHGGFRQLLRVPHCEDRVLDRAFRWDLVIRHRNAMPESHHQPKSIEAQMESSNSEEQDQTDSTPVPQEEEPMPEVGENVESAQSKEWWSASEPAPDWSQPSTDATETEVVPTKEPSTADVYFCGHTSLLPLSRAVRAIANQKLTGVLRAFWEQEPIELLARDGEIVFVTTRNPDLYCPATPPILADTDVVVVDRARNQQKETGTPFLLTLARQESIARQPALELMHHYGQKLFSELWTAARVWVMFEKNADLLSDVADIEGEPNVRDWALETLRLVEDPEQPASFDPTSIPAYTKEGFERVQRLKLTSDEAQFASQFNGARSVQQIAKNLRLDLKSARQLLFRFLAIEIVECWPASTAAEPEEPSFFQRLRGSGRRDR
ncbi:MAG TPA: hypothetical protein VGF61_18120 [Candidatus Acidoferrum sp.]